MLVEKEIVSPGTYWYVDEATGLPRKLDVTPDLTKYWHDQGSKMLGAGLTVPVPYEHDFSAHPMTPKDKLLNNAGEVKEYRLKGDTLFGVVDVQDDAAKSKIGKSIRWTSPWINSFTDGNGQRWDNVITHLALTTRPRITKQRPFGSVAAALSLATEVGKVAGEKMSPSGYCLSRAGRLVTHKKTKRLRPQYPMAFSLVSGARFADDDDVAPLKKKPAKASASDDDYEGGDGEDFVQDNDFGDDDGSVDLNPFGDQNGDVKMEELLCDLLNALGVQMPDNVGEAEFKRALYEATMGKIKELTSKAQASGDANAAAAGNNTTSPAGGANPLVPGVQQEQQPMYMSLEDINKITDPTMKGIALAMYNENIKLRAEADADRKTLRALNDAKLKEESEKRAERVRLLGKLSPKVKADLNAMAALPAMALSMGDGGAVVDPMAQTLAVLEKGLADLPRLLTAESSTLSVVPQPTDGEMSQEEVDKTADEFARKMGCPPERKAS